MDLEEKRSEIVREGLGRLSGKDILERVLSMPEPHTFVQQLSHEDFYWLIKKIGADDSIVLLELASSSQWQYLLDLEIWKRDILDSEAFLPWLDRLRQADCRALVKWLFTEAEYLAYHQFHKNLDVLVLSSKDDIYDIPDGFFTLDGTIYFRSKDPQYQEAFHAIIKSMAEEDFLKYQALFLGLTGFAPAELEEEMYRLRNVRLAEHGFLPFEEAVAVYSYLAPEALEGPGQTSLPPPTTVEDSNLIPLWPFQVPGRENLVTEIVATTWDHPFLDRLKLEFAGLCNMILSADGLLPNDPSILVKTSVKALSYINLALNRLCGTDRAAAEKLLRGNPLALLFRVGFGLAVKLRWEAQRWMKSSWFLSKGLKAHFWGETWGGMLMGLVDGRLPKFYTGVGGEREFKDFEWLLEVNKAAKALKSVMVMDGLLSILTERYDVDYANLARSDATFHPLIFNLWASKILGRPLAISGIEQSEARRLFSILRSGKRTPPFSMEGFKDKFIADFTGYGSKEDHDPGALDALEEALLAVWDEFTLEFESLPLEEIDPRYCRMLTVLPDPVSVSR